VSAETTSKTPHEELLEIMLKKLPDSDPFRFNGHRREVRRICAIIPELRFGRKNGRIVWQKQRRSRCLVTDLFLVTKWFDSQVVAENIEVQRNGDCLDSKTRDYGNMTTSERLEWVEFDFEKLLEQSELSEKIYIRDEENQNFLKKSIRCPMLFSYAFESNQIRIMYEKLMQKNIENKHHLEYIIMRGKEPMIMGRKTTECPDYTLLTTGQPPS
jgi:hypothetical protein